MRGGGRECVNVSRIVELSGYLYYNGTGTLMGCIILYYDIFMHNVCRWRMK